MILFSVFFPFGEDKLSVKGTENFQDWITNRTKWITVFQPNKFRDPSVAIYYLPVFKNGGSHKLASAFFTFRYSGLIVGLCVKIIFPPTPDKLSSGKVVGG